MTDEGSDPAPVRRTRRASGAFHFSLGAALARSFQYFGRHIVPTCLVALLIFAPLAIWQVSAAEKVWRGDSDLARALLVDADYEPSFWDAVNRESGTLGTVLGAMLPLLLQAIVALAVFQSLRGGRVQHGRSIGQGLARLLPVIGVAICTGLLVFVVMIAGGMLLVPILAGTRGGIAAMIVAGLFGITVMCVIYCIFFVSIPATVVEKVGPLKAMARSSWLTRRARWKIFVILLVVFGLSVVAIALIQGVIGPSPSSWPEARFGILLETGFTAILSAFAAICSAVAYHDLRKAKEGVGIEDLLKVFE